MGKKLVRQFKSHNAPAGARGYRPQAVAEHPPLSPPAAVVDYGVPSIDHGVPQRPPAPPIPPVVDLSGLPEIPMLVPAQIPRTMGTPALPPDWYPETPNRIWTPQPQPTTSPRLRRNTGEGDLPINIPSVNLPTTTTTPQRPYPPYTQPNVGVDTTAEIYNLPPQPQRQIIHERPTTIDYGPITTPIARPIQEDAGYIEPQQSYPITPGPQITATEQSFYEPQPVESAYAYPIQVDYPQPQPLPPDLNQDEITNLIDTLIPEQQEAKTINFPQEGPQWVEDPQTLAAQEAIDQAGFDQTDPSIYQPQTTTDEIPELTYNQPQQQDPFVIDYGPTYGDAAVQETTQAPYLPPAEQSVQELPVTQPPELGMPEIPVETIVDETDDTVTGGVQAEDDFFWEDRSGGKIGRGGGGGHQTNITEAIPGGPIVRDAKIWDPEGMPHGETSSGVWEYTADPLADPAQDINLRRLVGTEGEGEPVGRDSVRSTQETTIPAKTITPEGVVADDLDETYTVDTSAGVDIEQLPETLITGEVAEGPLVDAAEATDPVVEPEPFTPEIAGPPAPRGDVDTTGQVEPSVTTTPGQGGRKWLHTGPQDFADVLHQFRIGRGTTQGPPIITDTPAVSGPVVNRETGEITEKPLTWYQFEPTGSSVSPYGATAVSGTDGADTGTKDATGYVGGKAEPSPQNDWTSGVASTTSVQNFLDEASRAGVPVVQVDSFGNPDIDFSSSTWSAASDAGVDTQSLGKVNFKDADGNTKNVFEVGVSFVSKGIKGFTNLVFGNATDQSAKDLASNLGEKETIKLSDRVGALWKEYALAWETDDADPNNMRNPLTGEVQQKGDLQTVFVYNLLSGNVPAALGQIGASLANKIFTDFSKGLKNVFGSDVIQSVTSGIMDTVKFMGNKAGNLLGLDLFNKKVESKDFETQEMQDWEQAYGEDARGKEKAEGEVEGTDPEWMQIWDTLQIDALNPFGKDDSILPSEQTEFSVEGFNKRLQAGEITDLGDGKNQVFAVFTDRLGQSVSTSNLNVGSMSWAEADIVDLVKGGDGNAWAVVREGGVEVSRPITHGVGANEKPVEANIFGDDLGLRSIGGGSQVNRGSFRSMRPSGKVGVTAGGGGGLLKTVWEWITSKRE